MYTYNAAGLRVAQSVDGNATSGGATTFAWDWASGLPEMLSDGDALYLVGHETLGRWDGVAWRYVLPDALGSVRQAVDGAGSLASSREWTPYGVEVGMAQPGLGYTGEWWDAHVGLQYLRARWYDGQVGRLTRKDPFPGLRTQPFSLNPYPYVLANPVNGVDPSGLYGPDVHRYLTWRWVFEMSAQYTYALTADILADIIAEADQYVDEAVGDLDAVFGCRECHFCPYDKTERHVEKAIDRGNPYLFGASLHQLQDWYSHWNEEYTDQKLGHFPDSMRAGAWTGERPQPLLDDFFQGGHYKCHEDPSDPYIDPFCEQWVGSPHPTHPRQEVVQDIKRRNLGIDLNGLSDNDLIDLYLRKDGYDFDWPLRVAERSHFGLDTDKYLPGSRRDTVMGVISRYYIRKFLTRIIGPCGTNFDGSEPNDEEIRAFLTSE